MKTPREILLQRHQLAEARLDAVRKNVLAAQESTVESIQSTQNTVITTGTQIGSRKSDPITLSPGERAEVRVSVNSVNSPARSPLKVQEILSFLAMKLWQELFWPCRRVWIGLGAAWLVILALNLAAGQAPKLAVNKTARPSRETLMAVREQRQLLIQLLDSGVSASTPPPTSVRPRGELRGTVMLG
jgi:hypothetical protein